MWTCLNNCHFSTTIKNTFHITTLFLSGGIMKWSKIKRHNHPFSQRNRALGTFSPLSTPRVSKLLSRDGHTQRMLPAALFVPCPLWGLSRHPVTKANLMIVWGFLNTPHPGFPVAVGILFCPPCLALPSSTGSHRELPPLSSPCLLAADRGH